MALISNSPFLREYPRRSLSPRADINVITEARYRLQHYNSHLSMHTTDCTIHTTYYTIYTTYYTVHSTHYTLHTTYYTLHTTYYTLLNIFYQLHTLHILQISHYTLHLRELDKVFRIITDNLLPLCITHYILHTTYYTYDTVHTTQYTSQN